MDIRIEPLDTLFFRDGKPFTMGEDTWADSHLLPSPSVIYGALRTAVATENGILFENLPTTLKGKVTIKGIHYRIEGKITLPLPLDLVEYPKEEHIIKREKENKEYEVKMLEIKPNTAIFSSSKKMIKYFLKGKNSERVESIDNGLILTTEFEKYLSNEIEETHAYKLTDSILNESKIGIGRDDSTKTSDEGSLFRTDMKRGKDFEIGVNLDLIGYSTLSSLVRLGGEGKIINLSIARRTFKIANKTIDFKDNRFKIYFATDAILTDGEPDLSKLNLGKEDSKLVAACIGKPKSIGGFDMEQRIPKKMYKTVPAGSVFYYESTIDVRFLNEKQGFLLSDELSEQGFGIAYFGTWRL